MKRILSSLLLSGLILAHPRQAYSDIGIKLFPNDPVERTILADPQEYKTELKIPIEETKNLMETPIKNLYKEFSVGEELPLFSLDLKSKKILYAMPKTTDGKKISGQELSDKLISATVVGGGKIFSSNEEIDYSARLELFLNSPMIDDCISDGNSIYLVGGIEGRGHDFKKIGKKDLVETAQSITGDYSFSADIYIVPKSLWSDQFLILRVGAKDIGGSNPNKPNFNFSTTFEFPSLLGYKKLKNFKLSPYVSLYAEVPTKERDAKVLGQLGIKLAGESNKSLFVYTEAQHTANNPMNFSSGIKINF